MKKINGKRYTEEELRAIYRFFVDKGAYDDDLSTPSYMRLRDVGFNEDNKECTDLENTYRKLAEYDRIMEETHNKSYELAIMYKDFIRCLPLYLSDDGKRVADLNGWKLKELVDCDDKEIVESIQRMYDKYMEAKHKSFIESLRNIMSK